MGGRLAVAIVLASAAVAACSADDEPVFVDEVVDVPTDTATADDADTVASADAGGDVASTSEPTAAMASVGVTIDRAWSPENAVAELLGVGAVAGDPVTVDDVEAEPESFDVDADGGFVVRVRIEDEGAHTVCVADGCARVYTRAADAQTEEEIAAIIDEAIVESRTIFDGEAELPGWVIEVAGPMAGSGGRTDPEARTIVVHANRGRTVDGYVITILHEWGHAIDAERLTDDERATFQELRGYDAATPWFEDEAHGLESWSQQPGEDFAEAMVVLWTDGAHASRSAAPAGQPDESTLATLETLITPDA